MAFEPDRRPSGRSPVSPGSGQGPPEEWRARFMRGKQLQQRRKITIFAGIILLALLVTGIALMAASPGALGVGLAWVALFGLPVWVASWVMGADHLPEWYEPEHRVLLTDVDDLPGRDEEGEVVSRLERGTLISLGQRRTGEMCLYACGREHPLTALLVTQIRAASRLAEPREVEEKDRVIARRRLDETTRAVASNEPIPYEDR